jgi:plasmid stabilization system protein ParE
MAAEVVWSHRALRDVDGIADYIAKDPAAYAAVVVGNIITQTKMLPNFRGPGAKYPSSTLTKFANFLLTATESFFESREIESSSPV